MKKKIPNSNSRSKKTQNPNINLNALKISKQLSDLLKKITLTNKPKKEQYQINYLTYDQARDFCHQFIDSNVNAFLSAATPLAVERYRTATKEILMEVIREKYQMPNWEAALLLMHAGIELLELVDAEEESKG